MSDAQFDANPAGPVAGQGEDPGKTLGVVGLVLAFVAPLIGLIVSILAFNKSKQAGFANGLAKGGIIVAIVVMVLAIVIGVVVGVVSANAIADACAQLGPGVHQTGNTTVTCPG